MATTTRCTRESEDTLAAADGCGLFRIPSTQVALRFGFCQFHDLTEKAEGFLKGSSVGFLSINEFQ